MTPPTVAVSAEFRSHARTHALAAPARRGIRGIPRNQPPHVATTGPLTAAWLQHHAGPTGARMDRRQGVAVSHLADAHAFIEPIAAAHRNRGRHVTEEYLERAAALLVDLWATAARHGITPDHTHLPRAAFDTITAAIRAEHGWTIHTKHHVTGWTT